MMLKFRFFDVISKKMYFMDRIGEYTVEQLCSLSNTDDGYTKVMQFTGLTDKNGKDIYEGDIFSGNSKVLGRICGDVKISKYDDAETYQHEIHLGWNVNEIPLVDLINDGLEVIGNIHQHSHLLDKGE